MRSEDSNNPEEYNIDAITRLIATCYILLTLGLDLLLREQIKKIKCPNEASNCQLNNIKRKGADYEN